MPRTKGKQKNAAKRAGDAAEAAQLDPQRAGMPAPDSITEVRQIERGGKVYRIIRTNEVDEYEEPPKPKRKRARKR